MGLPEGPRKPGEQSAVDDDGNTADHAPTDGLVATVLGSVRIHCETWPDRYVEMRVDARTDRRE